jgi:hypothetical protein
MDASEQPTWIDWRIIDPLCEQCNSFLVEEGKLMILEEGGPISNDTRNSPVQEEKNNNSVLYIIPESFIEIVQYL